MFSDAPSQVAQEVHPCLVERSHGINCDRHKQVGLAEYSILTRLPVCCRLSPAVEWVNVVLESPRSIFAVLISMEGADQESG